MMAGAAAFQIGAALFSNPMAPIEILEGLNQYLEDNGIQTVQEIVGSVQPW